MSTNPARTVVDDGSEHRRRTLASVIMAPTLPTSLTPHICVLSSPDLNELLSTSSLPSIPDVLQSFSPFPQVTTRTTTLTSVTHASFGLRFSDLEQVEATCKEDEEQRANRTLDWIANRISQRCGRWVEDLERLGEKATRMPWWEELKRCTEGDTTPVRNETWNHPAAIILAVSTNAPNPLQAVTTLHSRPTDLPSWVDPSHLKFTLIVHPKDSALSDEEAGALYNAVKKQYGLHTYMLPLDLPNPPPAPVPVPATMPRLPPQNADSPDFRPPPTPYTPHAPQLPTANSKPVNLLVNTLQMNEKDIQQTARFTREFLVMSLIPWMERCVVEWNESFSSTRRLPSRLFSSTRRLFGSPAPSPAPGQHQSASSVSSIPVRSNTSNGILPNPANVQGTPPPQQRRLAEFATILGDLKLAASVWDSLQKESKGGSEILPLILSPSPAVQLHVSNAISALYGSSVDPPPHAQLRAIQYAVRWEMGIDPSEFSGNILEGERWLVWVARHSDEAPAAILLAHAAFLSVKKRAGRRAALWYMSAARRLEKCGIKPLTMFFLRKAHDLWNHPPKKELSPSFWDSEGVDPSKTFSFDAITASIEYPLARLLYTTGDVSNSVRLFLNLLQSSCSPRLHNISSDNEDASLPDNDDLYIDEFRIALEHLKSTSHDADLCSTLKLSFTFCVPQEIRVRYSRGDQQNEIKWSERELIWNEFRKSRGITQGLLKDCKASVNETFWIDLVVRNPLHVEVNLANLTLDIQEAGSTTPSSSTSFIETEVLSNVTLHPREMRTIPIAVKSTKATSLIITHAHYDFLSLLPNTESLSFRGRRLHSTPAQRQTPTYAPDVLLKVDVAEADHKLLANFLESHRLVLNQGENSSLRLWLSNAGKRPISEAWIVSDPDDEFCLDTNEDAAESLKSQETIHCGNVLAARDPYLLSIDYLGPGDDFEVRVTLHAVGLGERDLSFLIVYREDTSESYHQVRVTKSFDVKPLFKCMIHARPSPHLEDLYFMELHLDNISSRTVQFTQVTTLSPHWTCHAIKRGDPGPLLPLQSCRFHFGVKHWQESQGFNDATEFVKGKFRQVLQGREVNHSDPPPVALCCNHVLKPSHPTTHAIRRFIFSRRRHAVAQSIRCSHPHITSRTHRYIFPLYNPAALDVLLSWAIPSEGRSGYLHVSGLNIGVGHAALGDILEEAENTKTTSMYSETRQERLEVFQAIRDSEWNTEMNPLVVHVIAPHIVKHDFSKGPCSTTATVLIRNYSATLTSRFALKLSSDPVLYSAAALNNDSPAPYTGRTTYRGIIKPYQDTSVEVKLWISRPGSYVLGGWRLETEVLEDEGAHVRHRYVQEPSAEETQTLPRIVVCSE
ncbi:hypothetical protein E1B28_000934 [Marasmius oreades]|uniref:TPPC8 first Ig-like domain-containing protein n=1 Tax=Marasmius oreades TaxID=181124 RepID=A0A9P8AEX0_9AGAR|nr:uncharacterized protein E1B28_000934 [Marasmius oreades]KAG7099059.1 hypothetical protein E1B28_000934 [Marasmius oreades]